MLEAGVIVVVVVVVVVELSQTREDDARIA